MTDSEKTKFKVFIEGTLDQVWQELTRTDEVQKAMFDARMHTPGLAPGAPLQMRSANGKYTAVVGEVVECKRPHRFSHTMRFTNYDDPSCTVIYDLQEVEGGVEFTLTIDGLPVGTKTAKQMLQGGPFICKTLKSVVERGRPPLHISMLYTVFRMLAPVMTPKRCLAENWPMPQTDDNLTTDNRTSGQAAGV